MYRKFSMVYNMRVTNNDISDAINSEDILYILDEQVHKFKIQAAVGFILQKIKSVSLDTGIVVGGGQIVWSTLFDHRS